ncbi:MAG: teichuronic acid biosynthesis glycosyltransferase TuaH [Saprospiraceae bacterium]|jgi:teichuronic acid biosynthesis glycosyltransferase TuaH
MYRDLDIIYFTLFPWDHPYSSVSLSFAKEFSKNNRVFYVNHPYSLKDFAGNFKTKMAKERRGHLLTNKLRYEQVEGVSENIIGVHPPLTFPINWMPEGGFYQTFSAYNNKVILNTIKKIIQDYKLNNFIFINCFNPYFAGTLPKDFGQVVNIYQNIDDMTQEPYTAKHGARLEREVATKTDIVTVTSTNLWELMSPYNKEVHIVHNAADISNFERVLKEKFDKPEEIKHIDGKIIGFVGNLDHCRVDYPLLQKIAEYHSDKTLLLVGPINNTEYQEIGLDQLPNVIFAGSKNIAELPRYLQHMDCTLIPFLCNTLTKSIYPLKINEYLAAGKAVISTSFSKDIRGFADYIYLADNHDQFLKQIDQAIIENAAGRIQSRNDLAHTNTWEARVEEFWTIVEDYLMKKKRPQTA